MIVFPHMLLCLGTHSLCNSETSYIIKIENKHFFILKSIKIMKKDSDKGTVYDHFAYFFKYLLQIKFVFSCPCLYSCIIGLYF